MAAIHMSVAPGSISLVDDEDDEEGGLLGGVGDSDDRPGAGESSREGSRISRVDRVWEEHHGVLRGAAAKKASVDRGWAVSLLSCALLALGALIYAMGKGEMEVMERISGRGGVVGEGLLQITHHKTWVFVTVPAQSVALGAAWTLALRLRARAVIYLTIMLTPLVTGLACWFVISHASKHEDDLLLLTGAAAAAWAAAFTASACRKDSLTPTMATEASFRLWGAWAGKGMLLVTITMCIVSLFLWAACTACSAHLWSVPDASGEALSDGPRLVLLPLLFSCLWIAAWLDACLRFTVSTVVSTRYFASVSSESSGASEGALEALHTAVASCHAPLAKGSFLVSASRLIRVAQLRLESIGGERGKTAVGNVCSALPWLLPSVYVGPHAYVLLAQGGKGGFMPCAREAFKLLARNGLSQAADRVARASAFGGIRAISSSLAVLLLGSVLSSKDERLYFVTVVIAALVADAVLSRFTSLVHFAMDAILVCYAQEIEGCTPNAPTRCSASLHSALQENTQHERMHDESRYSTDRQAAFGGDSL